MRHTFPEWYQPDENKIRDMIKTGTIALDANILLDLYRVGEDQRRQILELFAHDSVRSRVWVPYQAALEYQRRRLSVAADHKTHYEAVRKALNDLRGSLTASLNGLRDGAVRDRLSGLADTKIGSVVNELLAELKALEDQHVIDYKVIRTDDPLRVELDNILRDPSQIGPKPSLDDLNTRLSLVDERYDKEIPPGYLDTKKSENREGDLLIWFEILDHAERVDKPLLFVSSDVKADWYREVKGEKIGPRLELLEEFATKSKQPYHHVRLATFLRHANEHLDMTVTEKTIASIDDLDEARAAESLLLRHQNPRMIRRLFDAREKLVPHTSAYQHVSRAIEIATGNEPYDPETVASAISVLDWIDNRSALTLDEQKREMQYREMLSNVKMRDLNRWRREEDDRSDNLGFLQREMQREATRESAKTGNSIGEILRSPSFRKRFKSQYGYLDQLDGRLLDVPFETVETSAVDNDNPDDEINHDSDTPRWERFL